MKSKVEEKSSVLSVTEITAAIKATLENNFPRVTVQGEISNFKKHSSGHLYFSLKDEKAQIQAIMFRRDAQALKQLPKDGDKVIVTAEVNVFPPQGKYQLLVQSLQLAGLGELLLKLEELKQKIYKLGWFSKVHKKPIPSFPKKIGVVTSPTGAAIQDILNVLTRRFAGVHVIINPVRVQGAGAAKEIAQAIKQFNQYDLVDVLIVGRGGGSIEDLWAFNEECVAKAIFESELPIVCAVGHETDHCIAEHIADLRAPTPSAAAELVVAETKERLKQIAQLETHLHRTIQQQLRTSWQELDIYRSSLDAAVLQYIERLALKLEGMQKQAHSLQPLAKIQFFKEKLTSLIKTLDHTILNSILERKIERLEKLQESLASIDPKNLLKRGYSIIFSEKEKSVINSIHQVKIESKLRLLVSDGEISATVSGAKPQ